MKRSIFQWVTGRILLAAAVAVCVNSGCGYYEYMQRLNETKKYYSYVERLNQNLGRAWSSKEQAVKLRAPLQFQLIPAPTPEMDEEGNPLPIPEDQDPRQPDYLNTRFPGLLGAWKTEPLNLLVDGRTQQAPAYMYVLSNWDQWKLAETAPDAPLFHEDVTSRLIAAIGAEAPAPDAWVTEQFPPGQGYVEPKHYTSTIVTSPRPINGVPLEFHLYLFQSGADGEIQGVVLFVIPQGVDARENIPERIALSLETLEAKENKPGRFTGGGGAPVNF